MDWTQTYGRIQALVGKRLSSITGKTDIKLESIDSDSYVVKTPKGRIERKTSELRQVVLSMVLNRPVHVDSALFGSGSSRSHPETVLANLPEVEWLRINRKKHIVWTGKNTHKPGTLKPRS